jgi:hypothetical protein
MNTLKSNLALLSIVILSLSSCSKREDINLGIKIIDNANLYSDDFKNIIANGKFKLPDGIPVLIITIDSIQISEIGSYANDELEKVSKLYKVKKERDNCFLILISRKPLLIQFRVGKDLRLESYKAGLSFGQKYLQYQENFISKGNENGLLYVLSNLEKDLPPALELTRIMKIQKPLAQSVFTEISEIAMPSDGKYTKYIFKPYSKFFTSLKLFSRPIVLIIFNALLLFLFLKLGQKLLVSFFGRNKLGSIVLTIWNIASIFFLSIPFWGSVIFLTSFRIEDHLLSEYLGIPLLNLSKDSIWFSSYTQIWFAVVIGIVVSAVEMPDNYLARVNITRLSSSNTDDFKKNMIEGDNEGDAFFASAEKGVGFAFLSLFMPRAISMLLLFYYILKIPKAISGYTKTEDWRK